MNNFCYFLNVEIIVEAADSQQLVTDPEFLRQVISNLPDVDPDSDAVKEAMGEKKEDDKKE